MNKNDCALNIQRQSPPMQISYNDCNSFEQEDKFCIKTCEWCLWKEKDQTCAIHKYPKRIVKCVYYQKQSKRAITWNVQCSPKGYSEDGMQPCLMFYYW